MKTILDDLLGKPLDDAVSSLIRTYGTAENMAAHREEALKLRKVRRFTRGLQNYRRDGETLIEGLRNLIIGYATARQGNNERIDHYGFEAVCLGSEHAHPVVVANLSISADAVHNYPTIDDFVAQYQARHSDFTYSHHKESISNGRVLCPHSQQPASLRLATRIVRIVPARNKIRTQETVVREIAERFARKQHAKNPREIEDQVRHELGLALGVGPVYDSIDHALEQTRHYLVNVEDLIGKIGFSKKTSAQFKLLGAVMKDKVGRDELVSALVGLAFDYIPVPLAVIVSRTKGQSFADKYSLSKYAEALNKGLESGELQRFLKHSGVDPPSRLYEPRDLRDFVGLEVIVHGDAKVYSGTEVEPPEGEEAAATKIYDLFYHFAEIPPAYRGIERRKNKAEGEKIPKYRIMEPYVTSTQIHIDPRSGRDIDDLMLNPRGNRYQAIHFNGVSTWLGEDKPIGFELKIKSNHSDSRSRLEAMQSHARHKAEQQALIEFLEYLGPERGGASKEEIYVIRILLSPDLNYQKPANHRRWNYSRHYRPLKLNP